MNPFSFQSLLLVSVSALLCSGCAAHLSTKVEVYNPELRIIEWQRQRGSNSSPTRLEARLRKQLDYHRKQKPIDPWEWYQEGIADLQAYNQLATNVITALAPFLPRGAVGEQFKTNYLHDCDAVVQRALSDVRGTWMKFLSREMLFPEAHNRIVGRFYQFSTEFASVSNPVAKGDETVLPRAARAAVVAIPARLADDAKDETSSIEGFGQQLERGSAGRRVEQRSDKGGVVRTDSVIETYTDPLVTAALDDTQGWAVIPAATRTAADGKSSVVLVRDGQFSFSIHAFDNDPTEVLAARARMAVSTAKIIAESVAMFSGVPAVPGLSKGGGGGTGTNAAAASVTAPPVSLPASAYLAIARERERRVTALLKEKPADATNAAAAQKWINEVNALFEPLILKQP